MKIPIKDIQVKENIRKGKITKTSVAELAESIKQTGLIHPVTVSKNGKGYLLVMGHRRLEACKSLKFETIEAIVVTDIPDVKSLQIAENIQRTDLTPWEEAEAFHKAINRKDGLTVQDIAKTTGKSTTYVHQISNLINLIPVLRKELAEEEMTLSLAIHFAKFPKETQEELAKYNWHNSSLKEAIRVTDGLQWRLKSAPFDIKTCSKCPKRTGAAENLFPEDKDTEKCLDIICYKAKCFANAVTMVEKMYADGKDFVLLGEGYSNTSAKNPDYGMKDYPGDLPDLTIYGTENWSKTKKTTRGAQLGIMVRTHANYFDLGKTLYVKIKKAKAEKAKDEKVKAEKADGPTPQGKVDENYYNHVELSKKRENHSVFMKVVKQIKDINPEYLVNTELEDLFETVFEVIDYNDQNRLESILFEDEKDLEGTYRVEAKKVWKKYINSQKSNARVWEAANKWIFLILLASKCPSDPQFFHEDAHVKTMLEFGKRLGVKVDSIRKETAPDFEAKRKLKLERFVKNHGRKPKRS